MWKFTEHQTSEEETVFFTDGYAVCPVCKQTYDVDHLGDEIHEDDDKQISHWVCSGHDGYQVIFSVYDEHPDYKQTYRDDHYDFYYVLTDYELD